MKRFYIIGCGVQAITQLKALYYIIPNIKKVKLYDINMTADKKLKNILANEFNSLEFRITKSAQQAVEDSDIIVTVTVADEPIVKNVWLKPGTFFSHVGSYQEEEEEVILNTDKIVLDEWEQVLHRGTPLVAKMYLDGKIGNDRIYANIGEIISGRKRGRENDKERVYYSTIGLGSEDIAVAYYIFKKAQSCKIGKKVKLWGSVDSSC